MDCENGTSLSQTIEKLEETPKDMKAFTFKNTGEEGGINHVGEEAVIFKDSDLGEPDEGNSNEVDGGPHIDNIADEIGEPAKELVDVVAGEPTVAEKDDEFGVSVGEPAEEESSNSMEEVKEKISAEPLKVIEIGKENSIESLKVTDNEDRSVNGEEILKANDRPVEDTSNSMQEFERETSPETLKVTYNEEKILKGRGEPVEEDNDQSMQEVEEDISTEGLKVNEDGSVNEEEFPKACGEPVEDDNDQSMQEVEEDISNEGLKVIDNEDRSVNEEFPKACGEPVEKDNDQSMQEVEEDISTEGLKVTDYKCCLENEEEFPKACGEPVEDDNDQSMQEVEEDISTECLKVIDNEEKILKGRGEPVEEDNDQSMQEVEEDISTEGLKVTDYKCCLVNKEEFPKACGEPEENNDQSMQEVEEDISTECLKVIDNEEKILKGRGEPVEEDNDQSMQEVEEDISTEGLKVNEDRSVNEEEFPKACGEPVEDDNDQSMQEVEEDISTECLKVIDNEEKILKGRGEPVEEDNDQSMQEVEEDISTEGLKVNEDRSVNEEEFPKACGEPVEDDNDQSMQEVEEDISNEGLNGIDNEDGSVNKEFPKSCGEPVKEESSNSMQEVKEEVSAEPLTVMAKEECSINDKEVPKANEDNIQCASAINNTVSRINTKSEVPKTCISDTKSLSNVKSSRALKKRKRKTQFKSSLYEEKSKVEDVKPPEGRVLSIHGDDYEHGSDGGEIEGTTTPEGYMPNIPGDDVGTDGVEDECLRTSSVKIKCFPFGFHLKIELLLMVKIWAMVNAATGATIPPQYYNCCTFETVSKISNFSINLGTEDICIYNPYAKHFTCTKGSICFLINYHNVMFCDKTKNVKDLFMENGQRRCIINSSDQKKLSDKEVASLKKHYFHNPTTTTVNPFPTTPSKMPETQFPTTAIKMPETRDHYPMIVMAVVVVILALGLCVFVCYKVMTRSTPISKKQGGVTAEEENELNALKEKETG